MGERPILFSAPMVRAILDGRKTQTRRIVKREPSGRVKAVGSPRNWHLDDPNAVLACPYGQPGDRLWVRETWSHTGTGVWTTLDASLATDGRVIYRATDPRPRPVLWWPSIHMPRWASRITLEVTGVRVERLQDISEADCVAEGIRRVDHPNLKGWEYHGETPMTFADGSNAAAWTSAQYSYCQLWEQINGPGSWDANPWVWVVEFAATKGEG